jgi:hypothetical protein
MFQFAYANGLYSTGNNQCGCAAIKGGPINSSSQGCKCAFPVAGEPPKKRDLEDVYAAFLTARAVEAKKPASPAAAPKTSSSNNKSTGTVSKKEIAETHAKAVQDMKEFKAKGGKIQTPPKDKAQPNKKVNKLHAKKSGSKTTSDKPAQPKAQSGGKHRRDVFASAYDNDDTLLEAWLVARDWADDKGLYGRDIEDEILARSGLVDNGLGGAYLYERDLYYYE